MSSKQQGYFFLFLLGFTAIFSAISMLKGGFYVNRHEGDLMHLTDILLRIQLGQVPHVDFVTPLGPLNFYPIVAFLNIGFGIGPAILWAQLAFALLLCPVIWWVARTRLSAPYAYAFGAAVLTLCLALVHGGAEPYVSPSMHYNRWGWAVGFLAVLIAALPPKKAGSRVIDGILIGAAFGFLLLSKVTFFVALGPGVLLALVLRQRMRTIVFAAFVLSMFMLSAVILGGAGFWLAYINDLVLVSSSNIRPHAGTDLSQLVLLPQFFVVTILLAAVIYLLRKSADPELGIILVLLAPGFYFITYQNWGNDPKWLALMGFLLIFGVSDKRAHFLAVLSFLLIAPSFLNMLASPVRHLIIKADIFAEAIPERWGAELYTPAKRNWQAWHRYPYVHKDPQFEYMNALAQHDEPTIFKGEQFGGCLQEPGLIGYFTAWATDLEKEGYAGKNIVIGDAVATFWFFGNFPPPKHIAPWYYGDLQGYENADYLLMGRCSLTPRAVRSIIADLKESDLALTEVLRNELYILYQIN